jgi:hypothetical protein
MSSTDFLEKTPISFNNKVTGKNIIIAQNDITKVAVATNEYLHSISKYFEELNFHVFDTLGQRNISGFIGEVFSNIFVKKISGFVVNPHGDGRPDLIDISTKKSQDYFNSNCFEHSGDGVFPIRSNLAPYKYGGLEVKSTIGIPVGNYKALLRKKGLDSFSIGMSRIDYLKSITYWGHHTSCKNLLGLYYDYYEDLKGTPQVIAVMQSELIPEIDWNLVSVGKVGSKKTSNTSLSVLGKEKILSRPIIVKNEIKYIENLRNAGLQI